MLAQLFLIRFIFLVSLFAEYFENRQVVAISKTASEVPQSRRNELDDFRYGAAAAIPPSRQGAARTIGLIRRRRLNILLLMPIMFKLGVILTLVLVLTAIAAKSFLILSFILTLALGHTANYLSHGGKLDSILPFKQHHQQQQETDHSKAVHIHLHQNAIAEHDRYRQSEPVYIQSAPAPIPLKSFSYGRPYHSFPESDYYLEPGDNSLKLKDEPEYYPKNPSREYYNNKNNDIRTDYKTYE